MKKLAILALAAVMLLSPLASSARAMEPFRQSNQPTEGKSDRRRDDRRRSDRDRDHRRDRDRDRRKHKSSGSVLGAAIGGLIVGSIIGSAASQPREPVLVCDVYGNCWYEYR